MTRILIAGMLLVTASLVCQASDRALTDEQWAADLDQLVTSVKEIHFKPFQVASEADFDAAAKQLEQRLAQLSDAGIIVAMGQLVAMLRDGHTRLHIPRLYPELALAAELGHSGTPPPKIEALKFGQSPLRYGLFSDGLFVVGATDEYRELIGQTVLRFDDTPVDQALDKVRTVSFFENQSRAKLMAPDRLALPGLIHILGITESSQAFSVVTADDTGKQSTARIHTLTEAGHDFADGAPARLPLWLARRDEYRWHQVLPDDDAIYVQVNEFEENPVTPYGDFVAETLAAAHATGVSRYILDLRHNAGGIGSWITPFITGLTGSEYNEYGRLFVLIGRTTFSAAQSLLHDFEEFTYAAFVGEPGGAKPSHFGDSRRVVLEHSGLTLRVSTIYWHSWLANDFREAINPHIPATLSAADYLNGSDPVLEAALRYDAPATLAGQVDEQFRQGNNQNALLLYQRYLNDAGVADHREAIPDMLSMADRLVEDGLERQGYFIYLLASRTYPADKTIASGLAKVEALVERSDD